MLWYEMKDYRKRTRARRIFEPKLSSNSALLILFVGSESQSQIVNQAARGRTGKRNEISREVITATKHVRRWKNMGGLEVRKDKSVYAESRTTLSISAVQACGASANPFVANERQRNKRELSNVIS